MTNELKPSWSKQQQAAAERQRQAWEEFFSAADVAGESSAQLLSNSTAAPGIAAIQARHEAELLRYPNVVGVASGIRTKGGKPTGENCLVVYVQQKVPRAKLDKSEILPRQIEGVPVDVVEIGKVGPLPI